MAQMEQLSGALARRLISFRIDDELAAALDEDMALAEAEAIARDGELSPASYYRRLFRKALRVREVERKRQKSRKR